MSENNFSSVMESLLKSVDTVLSTKTVVGEAKQIGDTITLKIYRDGKEKSVTITLQERP